MRTGTATMDTGFGLVVLGGLGFGLSPLFAKMAYADGLGPAAALLYRFLGVVLVTLPAVPGMWRQPRFMGRGLCLGALMALGSLMYFRALAVLPVAPAATIYYTYPLFTVLIGWIAWRRRPHPRAFALAGLVLAAVALVVMPGARGAAGFGPAQVAALLACFVAPVAFALLIHGYAAWLGNGSVWGRMAPLAWGHMLVLVPAVAMASDNAVLPVTPGGWQAVLGLATLASLLPQICFAYGASRTGTERTAIGGSTELMMSVAVGWAIYGEAMHPSAVAGVALLLAALMLARRSLPGGP